MKRLVQAGTALWLLCSPLTAQTAPVVVELFTSQGCSSCPPADAILRDLAARDDVIALALHVDYWDYIGWADEFADPRYADRQRRYAAAAGRRSVYTPQMIVNGETDIMGAKPEALLQAIAAHSKQPRTVDLALSRSGDLVRISATARAGGVVPMDVQLLRYVPEREAHITRGENAGKTIRYANVTQGWTVLGSWDGAAPLSLDAAAPGDLPVVVLIQAAKGGPILAAGQLK